MRYGLVLISIFSLIVSPYNAALLSPLHLLSWRRSTETGRYDLPICPQCSTAILTHRFYYLHTIFFAPISAVTAQIARKWVH